MRRGRREVDERWKRHLSAASGSGQNLAAYAREHGLNRKTLYAARKRLLEAPTAVANNSSSTASARTIRVGEAFVPVQIQAPRPVGASLASLNGVLRARLPNGIVVECDGADYGASFERWLLALMALPCSGSIPS